MPLLALACFTGGFVADQPSMDRSSHKRLARRITVAHIFGIAGVWLATVGPSIQAGWTTRLALAIAIGGGLGLAAGGLALIGLDARQHLRTHTPKA